MRGGRVSTRLGLIPAQALPDMEVATLAGCRALFRPASSAGASFRAARRTLPTRARRANPRNALRSFSRGHVNDRATAGTLTVSPGRIATVRAIHHVACRVCRGIGSAYPLLTPYSCFGRAASSPAVHPPSQLAGLLEPVRTMPGDFVPVRANSLRRHLHVRRYCIFLTRGEDHVKPHASPIFVKAETSAGNDPPHAA